MHVIKLYFGNHYCWPGTLQRGRRNRLDSNPGSLGYEAAALPSVLSRLYNVSLHYIILSLSCIFLVFPFSLVFSFSISLLFVGNFQELWFGFHNFLLSVFTPIYSFLSFYNKLPLFTARSQLQLIIKFVCGLTPQLYQES